MSQPTGYPEKILVKWNGTTYLLTWDDSGAGQWKTSGNEVALYLASTGGWDDFGFPSLDGYFIQLGGNTIHQVVWTDGSAYPALDDSWESWYDASGESAVATDDPTGFEFWPYPATVTVYRNGEPKVMLFDGGSNGWFSNGNNPDVNGESFRIYMTGSGYGANSPFDVLAAPLFEFAVADQNNFTHFLVWDGSETPVFDTVGWYQTQVTGTFPAFPAIVLLPNRYQLAFIQPKPLAYCNNAIVTLAAGINDTETVITLNEALDNYDPTADYMAVFEGAAEGDHPEIVRVIAANSDAVLMFVANGQIVRLVKDGTVWESLSHQGILSRTSSASLLVAADDGYDGSGGAYLLDFTWEGQAYGLPGDIVDGRFVGNEAAWVTYTGGEWVTITAPVDLTFNFGIVLVVTRAQEGTTATAHSTDDRLAIGVPTAQALSQMTVALTPEYLVGGSPIFNGGIYADLSKSDFARSFACLDGQGNLIPSLWVRVGDDDAQPASILGQGGNYSFDPYYRQLFDSNGAGVVDWNGGILRSPSDGIAVDWVDRYLVNDSGDWVLNWNAKQMRSVGGSPVNFDWGNGTPAALPTADVGNVLAVVNAMRGILMSYAQATDGD